MAGLWSCLYYFDQKNPAQISYDIRFALVIFNIIF